MEQGEPNVERDEANVETMKALPIVCTLWPGDRKQRLESLQQLTRDALMSYARHGLMLQLRYRKDAAARVRSLVARGQQCCAFLTLAVHEDSEAVRVTITAPEHAREAADELFAAVHLGALSELRHQRHSKEGGSARLRWGECYPEIERG